LRPVRRITEAAQELSATDLSRRIALDGPRDELRSLADTVDDMLERLESAFVAQRQLVDDASHELRNLLAVIQANGDAVLAHDDAPPVQASPPKTPTESSTASSAAANANPPATVPSTGQRRAGLGLAIVRQIAESHGGTVALHSELGVGSTFVT